MRAAGWGFVKPKPGPAFFILHGIPLMAECSRLFRGKVGSILLVSGFPDMLKRIIRLYCTNGIHQKKAQYKRGMTQNFLGVILSDN